MTPATNLSHSQVVSLNFLLTFVLDSDSSDSDNDFDELDLDEGNIDLMNYT